ncbi:ADA regulatory protein [Salmonella enterica subsp. arizonae]|uniref:ADA regulatory protein n=1 Tax=Salmonella enterica subsp. arizonae TaxID=59203 RepID=A0A379T8X1_SALER|nr:ADA regulatory protein [Salmonella enterica subsp. arizonae]
MKKALLTDDECWQRVQARDASADGCFVFAVRTTGIFCRPSCRSKRALRKNVRFFANAQQALDAGFSPPASVVNRMMRARSSGSWIRLPAPAGYLNRRRR